MNQKTDAFLRDLLNLCASHGVRLTRANGTWGFGGNGIKDLPIAEVAEILREKFGDYLNKNAFYVFRDHAKFGRRWLRGEKQWRRDKEKVGVKALSLPEARRLIQAFKKLPTGSGYVYGVECLFSGGVIVVR